MEIPGGGPAALGDAIQRLSLEVGNLALPQIKVFQDAQAATEVFKASRAMQSQVDDFLGTLSQNTDYRSYLQLWQDKQEQILSAMGESLTMEQSKTEANRLYTEMLQKLTPQIRTMATNKLVAEAEGQYQQAVNDAVTNGDEALVQKYIDDAFNGGIIADKKKEQDALIPKARYNAISNMMSTWDQKSISDYLSSPDAARLTGLDAKQLDELRSHFNGVFSDRTKLNEAQRTEDTRNLFVQNLTDYEASDPTKPYSRDRLAQALPALVGTPWYDSAKSILDRIDSRNADLVKAATEGAQGTVYSGMLIKLINFGSNPSATVSPVSTADIGSAYSQGRISLEEHDKLLAKFGEIAQEKASGAGRDDPAKVNAAWKIALDPHLTITDKLTKLDNGGFLGNGVTGSTFNSIRNAAADSALQNKDLAQYVGGVNKFYDAKNLQEKDPAKLQQNESRRIASIQSLLESYRKNPGDPSKWRETWNGLAIDNISGHVQDKLKEAMTRNGQVPDINPGGEWLARLFGTAPSKISTPLQYDLYRQAEPDKFKADAPAYSEWSTPEMQANIERDYRALLPADARDATAVRSGDNTVFQKGTDLWAFGPAKDAKGVIRIQLYHSSVGVSGRIGPWMAVR